MCSFIPVLRETSGSIFKNCYTIILHLLHLFFSASLALSFAFRHKQDADSVAIVTKTQLICKEWFTKESHNNLVPKYNVTRLKPSFHDSFTDSSWNTRPHNPSLEHHARNYKVLLYWFYFVTCPIRISPPLLAHTGQALHHHGDVLSKSSWDSDQTEKSVHNVREAPLVHLYWWINTLPVHAQRYFCWFKL